MEKNNEKSVLETPLLKEGCFLQSNEWLEFQKAFGKRTFLLEHEDFLVGLIEHELPIVGRYFYCPRGPLIGIQNHPSVAGKSKIQTVVREMIDLAKSENAGWIRIEPRTEGLLQEIRNATDSKIVKAPYDVQPKEIFILDIAKAEDQLLSEMKPKTRYNINLAKKRGVSISVSDQNSLESYSREFLKLTAEMARRQGIVAHPAGYYLKMLEIVPPENLKLYIAEYEGRIIAANLVLFFGETATYLHGASGQDNRNVMAPFLLQWQTIIDAKKKGCKYYDFGGVQSQDVAHKKHSDLSGVSNFKLGFSPKTSPVVFPGTYDIIVNSRKYAMYKGLQKAKMFLHRIRK